MGEPHARRFLQAHARIADRICAVAWTFLAAPPGATVARRIASEVTGVLTTSQGYLESVLDTALSQVITDPGDYLLRLDDDELPSPGMIEWLQAGAYRSTPLWKFPRRHWWGDANHYITTPPLYPDHQTRLSVIEQAGGRGVIHAGSPFGGGALPADEAVYLEHHKFLVKTREERAAVAARYDAVQPGAGTSPGMIAFQLPETLASIEVAPR